MITKSKSQTKMKGKATQNDEMRAEYGFDYAKAKPNRFAPSAPPGSIAVVLDPDVAQIFQSAESVNAVLRALMNTMPGHLRGAK